MPIEITMPRLSDTMEEGTLIKWRVKVGDKVCNGDLLADIETDKATMELQSYDDGTVAQLAVQEGQTTSVGTLILLLAQEGENLQGINTVTDADSTAVPQVAAGQQASVGSAQEPHHAAVTTGVVSSARTRVSPVARKMAEDYGVDLAMVKGSGPEGRIIKRDILAMVDTDTPLVRSQEAVAKPPAVTPPSVAVTQRQQSKTIAISNMRRTIARRLVESKTTIPHFTVTVSVNMDPLLGLRSELNGQLAGQGIKLSVNDFIVRASALALVNHHQVNSSWVDGGITQHGTVNVGVAISLPQEKGGGLVVATIRNTDQKTLRQISTQTRQLSQKAREQGLSLEEMADGTFTVSNLGMFRVDHFEAIINPPQAAILAVGAATQKPVVRDGKMMVGHEMTVTLSGDHRVVDGAMAAQFLDTLRQMLESPAALLV